MSSADLDRTLESPGPPPLPGRSDSPAAPTPPPIAESPTRDTMSGPPPVVGDQVIPLSDSDAQGLRLSPGAPVSAPRGKSAAGLAVATPLVASPTGETIPPALDPMSAVDPLSVHILDNDKADEEDHRLADTVRYSPPWLISCFFHAAAVLVLGMIPLLLAESEEFILEIGYTDLVGDQMELETFSDTDLLIPEDVVQLTPQDLEIVEEPMSVAEPIPLSPDGVLAISEIAAPTIGVMLTGREEGMKDALLAAYGGTGQTQAAVLNGLRWLHARQDADGLWSLSGRYRVRVQSRKATYADGGERENKCAATAMAMLAFQGYGQTHRGGPHENFRQGMQRAVSALLKRQDTDGSFTRFVRADDAHLKGHHRMYTQALCTFALCELYAMSKDSKLQLPAQRTIDYLVKYQDRAGGWRYVPGQGSDLSVTGWVMMALQSARMGGLKVPQPTLYKIEGFLDKVAHRGGSHYAYTPGDRHPSLAMTAEGLLCRQYLGWERRHAKLIDGADLLVDNRIDFDSGDADFYYWYYATQVLHNMEGEFWHRWNDVMATELPARQEKDGREPGSWSPKDDAWGEHGGRLYTTCLAIYMLEVYYRHLPIYSVNLQSSLDEVEESDESDESGDGAVE